MAKPRPFGRGPYGTDKYGRYSNVYHDVGGASGIAFVAVAALQFTWQTIGPCSLGDWALTPDCSAGAWTELDGTDPATGEGGSGGGGGGGDMIPPTLAINALGPIGSMLHLDCAISRVTTATLTTNLTDFVVTSSAGYSAFVNALIAFTQGGTGGHTITYPANFRWQGSYAPALQTVPGATDLLNIVTFDGGTTWLASIAVQTAAP